MKLDGSFPAASIDASFLALVECKLLFILLQSLDDGWVIHRGVHLRDVLKRPLLNNFCRYRGKQPRVALEVTCAAAIVTRETGNRRWDQQRERSSSTKTKQREAETDQGLPAIALLTSMVACTRAGPVVTAIVASVLTKKARRSYDCEIIRSGCRPGAAASNVCLWCLSGEPRAYPPGRERCLPST